MNTIHPALDGNAFLPLCIECNAQAESGNQVYLQASVVQSPL